MMTDREKVIKGLECCSDEFNSCESCPYNEKYTAHCVSKGLAPDALKLLKNEPNAPAVTAPTSSIYYRLMEIKNELETENETLKADVKELRRLTGSLTNLCENLLKRIAADERP